MKTISQLHVGQRGKQRCINETMRQLDKIHPMGR